MMFLLPTTNRPHPPSLDDPDAVESSWCPVWSTIASRRELFPTELIPVWVKNASARSFGYKQNRVRLD